MSNAGTTAAAATTARRVDSTTLNQSTTQPLTATIVPYNAKGVFVGRHLKRCVAATEKQRPEQQLACSSPLRVRKGEGSNGAVSSSGGKRNEEKK